MRELLVVHISLNGLRHPVEQFGNLIETAIKDGLGAGTRGVPGEIGSPSGVRGLGMTFVLVPGGLSGDGGEGGVADGTDAMSFVARR